MFLHLHTNLENSLK